MDWTYDYGAQGRSLQPRPFFPIDYRRNVLVTDAEYPRQNTTTLAIGGASADAPHVIFIEFGVRAIAASIVRAVQEFVGHVLLSRFPRQMIRRDAPKVTLSTLVRSLVLGRWRLTMHQRSGYPVRLLLDTVVGQLAVALFIAMKRPNQAVVARVRDNYAVHVNGEGAARCSGDVSSAPPNDPRSVLGAHALRVGGIVATFDRAYWVLSHAIFTVSGWLEGRAERWNAPRLSSTSARMA